jgi:hypothetical protein
MFDSLEGGAGGSVNAAVKELRTQQGLNQTHHLGLRSKMLTQRWNEMSAEDKAKYESLADCEAGEATKQNTIEE